LDRIARADRVGHRAAERRIVEAELIPDRDPVMPDRTVVEVVAKVPAARSAL
jgi:hypothetical protein